MSSVTPEYAAEIIDKFEVSEENKQRGIMGIEGTVLTFTFLLPQLSFHLDFQVCSMFHPGLFQSNFLYCKII